MFRNRKNRAFTLIELLVVVGIIAVLITLTLPSLTGLGRGTSMQGAVSELRSTLALARQWAVTHRENTYVVFPDGDVNMYPEPADVLMAFRSYNVYGEKSGYLGEWRYLPPGVYFIPDNATQPDADDDKNVFKLLMNVPFPDNGPIQNLPALAFNPNGGLKDAGNDREVYLGEGYMTVDTTSGTITDGLTMKNNTIVFSVFVTMLTGQLRVKDYSLL